jgi:iron complex transport system substrate-binding protein
VLDDPEPLAEGGFVLSRSLVLVATAGVLVLVGAAAAVAGPAAARPTAAAVPQRIVSLSPTATESLFAIGAGPQVIAVDDQSDYPKVAPRTKLSGFTPNVEAIASYRPDLVIISFNPKGLSDALAKLRIRTVLQPPAATLADAYAQIGQLGRLTGHTGRAATLVSSMKSRIAAVVAARRRAGDGRTVYHELDQALFSATSKTFIGRIYQLFGLRNIADAADTAGTGYPQLSPEYIVEQDPDLIVLADTVCCGQTAATVAARPGWDHIRAVRTGSVIRLDDSVASRWGPRVVQLVQAVGRALARPAQ